MFRVQILMVARIIMGVLCVGIKKGNWRKYGFYMILFGSVIGTAVFAFCNMYIVVLLCCFGAGLMVKEIHHTN